MTHLQTKQIRSGGVGVRQRARNDAANLKSVLVWRLGAGKTFFCDCAGGSDEEHQRAPSAVPLHTPRPLPELHQVSGGVIRGAGGREHAGCTSDFLFFDFFVFVFIFSDGFQKVPDRAARLHQHHPGPHQPLPLQLLLSPLRGLEGGAEPPDPDAGDEG